MGDRAKTSAGFAVSIVAVHAVVAEVLFDLITRHSVTRKKRTQMQVLFSYGARGILHVNRRLHATLFVVLQPPLQILEKFFLASPRSALVVADKNLNRRGYILHVKVLDDAVRRSTLVWLTFRGMIARGQRPTTQLTHWYQRIEEREAVIEWNEGGADCKW